MGKLLAEAQGEAITGQLKTSTLNLGYSGDDHCHSHVIVTVIVIVRVMVIVLES